jgi:hypothetical protein
MEAIMDRMTQRNRSVGGVATSFLDLGECPPDNCHSILICFGSVTPGYNNVGLDDNWQACHEGYLGSFHDQEGNPMVNLGRFPSMKGMADYGHGKGLRVGW